MKKKLVLTLIFIGLFCFVLGACNNQDQTSQTPSESSSESAPPPVDVGNFEFTPENFPHMGGSLAAQPLGEAVVATALGISRSEADGYITFEGSTTSNYNALVDGNFDILLAYEPSGDALSYAQNANFEWEKTAIGRDALVFIVNKDNPVDNITEDQIRGIYSGQITNWSELGGSDSDIIPYQRNTDSGSQTLFDKLVGLDDNLMVPPSEQVVGSMIGLLEVTADYDNSAYALGYTVYYYLSNMEQDKLAKTKILTVDGVACSNETIASGEYPYVNDFYAVISKDLPDDAPARVLYNWICSDQGKELAAKENYVTVS